MPRHTDTIAALATPAGTAALAIVRISGPDTKRLATALAGELPSPRLARHLDYRDERGTLVDDVVLTYFQEPRSYTGEDAFEISCHGNPFIAQRILEDLFARGCRPAEPGEFTQRAFLNGRLDLSQAEAVMDVIHARSERALAAAQQQLRGALGRRMNGLIDVLLGILARIEAYIDFPEEDLPPEDRAALKNDLQHLIRETDRLLATSHYGEILRDGIKTVIVGLPNVGKSSLLNRLVGRERAIVSPEPGTTRDFLEERIILGSHCLRLIDTAGLNPSPAPVERMGIEKTRERAAEADLLLAVADASEPGPVLPAEMLQWIQARAAVVILNKIDLAPRPAAPDLGSLPAGVPVIRVSARTGEGMEPLVGAIVRSADSFQRDLGEDAVAVNARHAHALSEAQEGLRQAGAKLAENGPVELLASDLRGVLSSFGEIVGRIDNERMLDQLFASFCIGK
jgi:tRNA modification GTPase